jgi:hypothetical protein
MIWIPAGCPVRGRGGGGREMGIVYGLEALGVRGMSARYWSRLGIETTRKIGRRSRSKNRIPSCRAWFYICWVKVSECEEGSDDVGDVLAFVDEGADLTELGTILADLDEIRHTLEGRTNDEYRASPLADDLETAGHSRMCVRNHKKHLLCFASSEMNMGEKK